MSAIVLALIVFLVGCLSCTEESTPYAGGITGTEEQKKEHRKAQHDAREIIYVLVPGVCK